MKIAIIGTGYVGLPTGVGLAELGNQVICVDKIAAKIEALNKGKVTLYEEGLEELYLKHLNSGALRFTQNMKDAVPGADVVMLAVGTPPHPVTKEADLQYIYAAAEELAPFLDGYTVVAEVYDIESRKRMECSKRIDIPADGVVNDALTIHFPEDISQVHFIKLRLKDEKGKEVSSNFYWRSNDRYEGKETVTGPATSGFESLSQLKQARLKTSYKFRKEQDKFVVDIFIKNISHSIAFFNQIQLLDTNLKPVRPSFYTDNFFSLLPGENKKVTIETGLKDLLTSPVLVIKGWNIERKQYQLSSQNIQ